VGSCFKRFISSQIRIACRLIRDEEAGPDSPYMEFIESCLRHKSEIVIYEAAQALVNLKTSSTTAAAASRELGPAVSVLQLFCSSPKPTLRFAAVRTLNKVRCHPESFTLRKKSTPLMANLQPFNSEAESNSVQALDCGCEEMLDRSHPPIL
jgi:hypothetical protein